MKTTIKLGLCAAALLLVLAGCNNAVKPTEVNDSMVKAAVTGNVSGTNAFKVDSIDNGTAYGDDTAKYVVKVTFNKPVTEDSLHNGITFYKLSNATETYTMPAKGAPLTGVTLRVVEKDVYFTLPFKKTEVKDLYVFVDATKVEAANGAGLNQDEDTVWGESGDDDYAKYILPNGPSTSALTKGEVNFNKQCEDLNKTLPADLGLTISYTYGSNAETNLVKKIEITSNASLQALFDSSEWTEDGKIAAVTDIINKHLKFEQYNWEKKEWEPLSPSFKRDSGKWVSDVTVRPDYTIRYKVINTHDIKLSSKLYGYDLRWSLKANAKRTEVCPLSSYKVNGSASLSANSLWPSDALYTVKTTQGRVEIIFDPWHAAITSPSVPAHYTSFNLWADNTWYSVTPENKETGKCSLFTGFATGTLIKDNFKCFEGTGTNRKELTIKDISYVSSSVAVYPNANNKVVILFNDTTKTANDVYISPNVRTAVFSGSYAKGSERVPCEIKSLSFANTAPTTDPYQLGGWIKK